MEWIKLLKQFFNYRQDFEPVIGRKVIFLSGLFSFNDFQRELIHTNSKFKNHKPKPEIVDLIKNQYYPIFRKFILNDSPKDYTEFDVDNNYRCLLQLEPNKLIHFNVYNIKLSFFDKQIGLGIYTYEVQINNDISYSTLIKLLRRLRSFNTKIECEGLEFKMESFIEDKILCYSGFYNDNLQFKISKDSEVNDYSGGKLKMFLALEIKKKSVFYSIDEALYELGTFTDYLSSRKNINSFSPTEKYFNDIISNKIAIYQDWEALALFDTYVHIGNSQYFDGKYTVNTIKETYFKIYLFNLYCKYYLFKVNSNLETSNVNIKKLCLNSFLNKYELNHISYNFLPNVIHKKIKDSLQIESELTSLRGKIELISKKNESRLAMLINLFLMFIAALGIIPFIKDLPDAYNLILGIKNDQISIYGLVSVIAFSIFIFIKATWRKN